MNDMKTIVETLKERNTTHGEFRDNSAASQSFKKILRSHQNWEKLAPYKKEGLEMMMHKIGRILEGNENYQDHWDDLVGYAKLMSDRNHEDLQKV